MIKKMDVLDIFFLSDGQIVISGRMDDAVRFIPKGLCNLYRDGIFQEELWCSGENMIKRLDPSIKIRSISVKSMTQLNSLNVHGGHWHIEFFDTNDQHESHGHL